jgi:hypothetical protein
MAFCAERGLLGLDTDLLYVQQIVIASQQCYS